MSRRAVSAMMMFLLVLGSIALALSVQPVRANGTIYIARTAGHDVAIFNVTSYKTVFSNCTLGNVTVTAANLGSSSETFKITVYANHDVIRTFVNVTLNGGEFATLTTQWNTTGFAIGNYTLNAYAWPVPNETNTADSNFTGGLVYISIIGDITGGTSNPLDFVPDGKVDMKDIGVVARFFWQKVSPATSDCDVSGPTQGVPDGKIDWRDIGFVARHSVMPLLTGTWIKYSGNPVLTDSLGINEPSVIYEGNPQILTGYTNVYKMWYRVGWLGTTPSSICYAESADGLTWVKYSGNPVLSYSIGGDHWCPFVFKYASTYYMYVHAGSWGSINRYVSSDGRSWSLDTASTLSDLTDIGNTCVWAESSNDWRMIYEYNSSHWNLGYATSSDGGRTWSMHGLIISDGGGPYVLKSGSTYYMWYHSGGLPTQIYLTTSTDLVNWVGETLCVPIASGLEASQTADPTVLVVGTTVRMWYTEVAAQSPRMQCIGMATLQS